MWSRAFSGRSWSSFKFTFQSFKRIPDFNVKLTLRVGSTFVAPSIVYLDLPKATPSTPPQPTVHIKKVTLPEDPLQGSWQPTIGDVMHVAKLLLIGGLAWGIGGALLGVGFFRVCSSYLNHHVTRMVSVPACIISGAILSVVGLYRGLGHSLVYFINKGLAVHVLNKVVPTRVGNEKSAIHWDAAVTRVTYSFKIRAEQSGFFVGLMLRSFAKRLENFLLLVKEEDKIKHGNLSDAQINHKLTKVISRQMRKPLYVVGVVYGAVAVGVGLFVWRSS